MQVYIPPKYIYMNGRDPSQHVRPCDTSQHLFLFWSPLFDHSFRAPRILLHVLTPLFLACTKGNWTIQRIWLTAPRRQGDTRGDGVIEKGESAQKRVFMGHSTLTDGLPTRKGKWLRGGRVQWDMQLIGQIWPYTCMCKEASSSYRSLQLSTIQ